LGRRLALSWGLQAVAKASFAMPQKMLQLEANRMLVENH
jgi:hypothetical protein